MKPHRSSYDDKTVIATVESLGKRTMTRDEFKNMPDDLYNDIVFARAAFALFDLEI